MRHTASEKTQPDERPLHLLDASTDCVKVLSAEGALLSINPDGLCLMEIEDFSILQGLAWASLWPDDHRGTVEAAVTRAAGGRVARFSAFCPTAKGTPKHWDVLVSPIHHEDGRVVQLMSVSRDVTKEVMIASERALVTRELSHRIKNLFAVVDGMIGMSARGQPAVAKFAGTLRERLGGLSRAIAYVYSDPDAGGIERESLTLHALLRQLLLPYGSDDASERITLEGDDFPITEGATTPLALIFTELATNALKYGSLSKGGDVELTTCVTKDSCKMVWLEKGTNGVTQPSWVGFGTTLLDRISRVQLQGTLERVWADGGLLVELTVPLNELTNQPRP